MVVLNFIVLETCKTLSFNNFLLTRSFFLLIINLYICLEICGKWPVRPVRHGPQHHSQACSKDIGSTALAVLQVNCRAQGWLATSRHSLDHEQGY